MALYIERCGQIAILPVLHHSYEFTLAAREACEELKPDAVALEYPAVLQELILQGIRRLPRVSVLTYGDKTRHYIRIEPVDPFVEAARHALQDNAVHCIDAAIDYPEVHEPLPDTYAVARLGHRRYCEMVLQRPPVRLEEDDIRERAMAYHLQQLQAKCGGTILVLCGLAHLKGLAEQLAKPQARPFEKKPGAKLYHLSSASLGEVMGQFPYFTAVYEKQRCATTEEPAVPHGQKVRPAKTSGGMQLLSGQKAQSLSEFVLRAQQDTAKESRRGDRQDILRYYVQWCRRYYEQEIAEQVNPQLVILMDRFLRKYSHVKGMLLPGFYELLIAGRACMNSHFCYRMWEIGTFYPPQQGPSELEIIELRAHDIFPLVEKVRMNPNAPLKPRASLPRFLLRRDKQKIPKEDEQKFSPFSICSYQPEDLVIEDYGQYLRGKGKSMLSEERKRVQPFETSLLDGIDLRETIRNWHTGKLFVQECMTVKGEVDSLVVIFDEDGSKYPYAMTWLGEHHQESDMAFYATDPGDREVGPGIRKALYGGFLMTMPPGRLFDVFHDPAYRFAESHSERLLLAAIDYGLQRFVIYAGPKPPRPAYQVIAGRYGKRILYIPLAQLSPVMVQKIRTFHILSDKSVRDYAKNYIW